MPSKVSVVATLAFTLMATTASSQEALDPSWQYQANIYLWGADIGGKTTTGDDVSVNFDDLIDNLNFGAMGGLQAKRDKWWLFIDAIYLDVENSENFSRDLGPSSIDIGSDIELKAFITTFGGGYEVFRNESTELHAIGGFRYLNLDVDLELDIGPANRKLDNTYDALDAIVGFQGKTDLNDKWYLTYYADLGAGESDRTWQALGAVNYRFEKFDLALGYRHYDWKLNDFGPFKDLDIGGAFIGARFDF